MTILFENTSPKIRKEGVFGCRFRHYCFFREILQIVKCEVAHFKYGNSFFQSLAQKYPNNAFLVPNLLIFVFLFFLQNFAVRPSRGCWFQIGEQFYQILTQKYQNEVFLVLNLDIFTFTRNLFEKRIVFRKFYAKNIQIRNNAYLGENLDIFLSLRSLAVRQVQGSWFQIWQ